MNERTIPVGLAKHFGEIAADRDRHRANEKRLREAIWEFGRRYLDDSPERAWASSTLYGDS